MSQSAKDLISDGVAGRTSSDGYKPANVPNALKVIYDHSKKSLEDEDMTSTSSAAGTNVLSKSLAHLTYSTLYTSDLQKSAKWYYKAFGIQIVAINSDFATMEFAPGRIVFFERNSDFPRKISFSTRNMEAVRRQLQIANVEFDADEDSYLRIKDIDNNTIEVWKTVSEVEISMPNEFVRDLIRCRLETKDEIRLIAMQIAEDLDFHEAAAMLRALLNRHKWSIEAETFIASRYSGKVEAIFVCMEVSEAADGLLEQGLEYIPIPKHDYCVFPVSYDHKDKLRTKEQYGARAGFMSWSFTKPEESYYILEFYRDDCIELYMPYYWDKGWKLHDNAVNGAGEVEKDE
ncbi:VOC family protein [Paenibacillus sp. GYB004]|uniref:VOC family protein n=1 Tax=Paenibacillus sp. GYB004 TaxID=2994393 RepID=UPI002F969CBE